MAVEIIGVHHNEAEIVVDGQKYFVPFVLLGNRVQFAFDGEIYTVDIPERGVRLRARHHDHSLEAPMPGLVLKVLFGPGDAVEKGAPLIILEAMKMEHAILAPRDGVIAAVNCREGEMVQPGVDLVTMR
ncbi:MAG: biotin/lipoyl-containing protein [Acidobacteriota bacterium]